MLTTKPPAGGKNLLLTWKLLSWLLWGALLAGIIGSLYFVYFYIYQTLDEANSVVVLNIDSGVYTIDIDNYDLAKKKIDLKLQLPVLPANLRNIFAFASSTTAADDKKTESDNAEQKK